MAIMLSHSASQSAAPQFARNSHQPAARAASAAACRQQQSGSRHRAWSQTCTDARNRASLRCSAEPTDSIEPKDAPLPSAEENGAAAAPLGPRDDDVLPDSLTDAIAQASESTVTAMQAGSDKIVAEVLLGEFWDPSSGAVFAEEGDQQRFWKLTRRFAENLAAMAEDGTRVRALYPDMGVAAMLKNQWGADIGFAIGSLSDRTSFQEEDDIIVFAAPDPQGVAAARRITAEAGDRTVVMFNPRLASGEVGIGLNVRRMVLDFLSTFTTAYSLRPIGDIGTVFRRYPEPWKVFIEDADLLGRYQLAAERDSRPAGEALDIIIQDALGAGSPGGDEGSQGLGQQVVRTIRSLQGFAKSLTR